MRLGGIYKGDYRGRQNIMLICIVKYLHECKHSTSVVASIKYPLQMLHVMCWFSSRKGILPDFCSITDNGVASCDLIATTAFTFSLPLLLLFVKSFVFVPFVVLTIFSFVALPSIVGGSCCSIWFCSSLFDKFCFGDIVIVVDDTFVVELVVMVVVVVSLVFLLEFVVNSTKSDVTGAISSAKYSRGLSMSAPKLRDYLHVYVSFC